MRNSKKIDDIFYDDTEFFMREVICPSFPTYAALPHNAWFFDRNASMLFEINFQIRHVLLIHEVLRRKKDENDLE
jgi:hypothetical protein